MEKQLNVKLAFNADTSRAQAQIQALQLSLNNVGMSTAKLPITKEILEAQIAANQLKVAMNSAFNVDTGKIDLLKFNQSIQKSGTNLVEIRNRDSGQVGYTVPDMGIWRSFAPGETKKVPLEEFMNLLNNPEKIKKLF